MIIECPHCDSRVECLVRGEIQEDVEYGGPPTKVVLLECKVCHSPLLGKNEGQWFFENIPPGIAEISMRPYYDNARDLSQPSRLIVTMKRSDMEEVF